jgi:hypothetical protein
VIGLLALTLGAAPALAAGLETSNSFSELAKEEAEPAKTTATTSSSTTSEPTNSHTTVFIALGAAVLLLSGIGFVIARDARKVAPAGDIEAVERGAARDSAAKLARRRAKAKAARQQRKRNR